MPSATQVILGKEFPEKVIPLIASAQKSIDIVVFDWRFYPTDLGSAVSLFNQAIIQCARRNVAVRCITNSADVLTLLKDNGIEARRLISKSLVHCKLMIIDGEIVVTGSHNYTQSAFSLNFELSLVVYDPEVAAMCTHFFGRLFNWHD